MPATPRLAVVAVLGTAQTLAWASSYYLPALLAAPMARTLGIGEPTVFAAFSLALLVSAFVGPGAGRAIDRRGGRSVLMATSLLFAAGLALLGVSQQAGVLFAGWALLGVAMGSGLYEAGFATLVRLYRDDSRGAITGITLLGGLASTVGWPLTAWMEARLGWRGACFGWAALHLLVGLPLNAWLPQPDDVQPAGVPAGAPPAAVSEAPAPVSSVSSVSSVPAVSSVSSMPPMSTVRAAPPPAGAAPPGAWTAALLAFVFAATWFTSTAMAAHLPRMLQSAGASLTAAVAVGALVGPAQVAARVLEFGLLRRVHPLLSARLAALAHPAGAVTLLAAGPAMAAVFAVLHGAGNGILTIAKGTLPLVLFGPVGYGARQGWLMVPARIAQAFAPFAFGLALDRWGPRALWLSAGLGLLAFAALLRLRAEPLSRNGPAAP